MKGLSLIPCCTCRDPDGRGEGEARAGPSARSPIGVGRAKRGAFLTAYSQGVVPISAGASMGRLLGLTGGPFLGEGRATRTISGTAASITVAGLSTPSRPRSSRGGSASSAAAPSAGIRC